MLFLNRPEGFVLSDEQDIRLDDKRARTGGAVFVDLDNDGDLDLSVSTHAVKAEQFQSVLFENLGGGRFRQVQIQGDWPTPLGQRNVGVLDLDADGLLDLILTDNNYGHYRKDTGRLHVLRNKGGFAFEDVTEKFGFPMTGTMGKGMALGDVNNDGVLDVFVCNSLRLFVSGSDGKYHASNEGVFVKPAEEYAPGADFADFDGDGLLDLVTTYHNPPTMLHIYRNEGLADGHPKFVEITARIGQDKLYPPAGPTGEPIKTTHVALQDFDNDGKVDIFTPIICTDGKGDIQPMVLRNLGVVDGLPRFSTPPYERMFGYYAPGPVADFDDDGRLEMFLPTWGVFTTKTPGEKPEIPSYLFRNVTQGGKWLKVRVAGDGKTRNTMGIGATVRIYEAGFAGDEKHLLGRRDVVNNNGWCSGTVSTVHFGLGEKDKCDVVVTWGKDKQVRANVAAGQTLVVKF